MVPFAMGSVAAAGAMPPIRVSRSVASIRSTYRPLRRRGRLPKAREPLRSSMGLVCLDTLAVSLLSLLLSCVWRATLPRHSYVDILTLSVQHFDAQPALDVHEVSFLVFVFGTLTMCRRSSSR